MAYCKLFDLEKAMPSLWVSRSSVLQPIKNRNCHMLSQILKLLPGREIYSYPATVSQVRATVRGEYPQASGRKIQEKELSESI